MIAELETLRAELRALQDRQAVTDLVDRLGLWLDAKRFDEAREILTDDVRVQTPGGVAEGIEPVARQAACNHAVPTQHVISNVRVEIDGDRATAGANLLVTFAGEQPRTLGERYRFEAAASRTGGG